MRSALLISADQPIQLFYRSGLLDDLDMAIQYTYSHYVALIARPAMYILLHLFHLLALDAQITRDVAISFPRLEIGIDAPHYIEH